MYVYRDMYIINTKALAEIGVNITRLFRFFSYISCLAAVLSHFIVMMLLISKFEENKRVSVNFPCQWSKVGKKCRILQGVILPTGGYGNVTLI